MVGFVLNSLVVRALFRSRIGWVSSSSSPCSLLAVAAPVPVAVVAVAALSVSSACEEVGVSREEEHELAAEVADDWCGCNCSG